MPMVEVFGSVYQVEFKKALNLVGKPPSFMYGCPEHQIKTEAYCPKCEKVVRSERIFFEEPTDYENPKIINGELVENVPFWAMVENGFSWVLDDEKLKQLLAEKKGVIRFKFAEKQGLNAKPIDNYVFIFSGHLARVRADTEHKNLMPYEDVVVKTSKKEKKKVNVMKKQEVAQNVKNKT